MTRRLLIVFASLAIVIAAGVPSAAEVDPTFSEAVILAANSVWLRQNSEVLSGAVYVNEASPGPTLADGEMTVGLSVVVSQFSDLRADSIKVKQNAEVGGRVYCNELNDGTGLLDPCSPQPLPVLALFPGFVEAELTGNEDDLTVPIGGSATLPPGAYGDVLIKKNSTVTFTGGDYDIADLNLGTNVDLFFEGPSRVRIAGKFDTDQNCYVGPSELAGIVASDVVFYVGGINGGNGNLGATPKAASIGKHNEFRANLYAPNGTILIGQNSTAVGAFVGRDVQLGLGATAALESAFAFVDQPPTAGSQDLYTDGSNSLLITLAGADPEEDDLVFSISSGPSEGTLSAVTQAPPDQATVTYTPTHCSGSGSGAICVPDSFVFRATDPYGLFAEATVFLNSVEESEPEPDVIVAQGGSVEVLDATSTTIELAAFAPSSMGDLTFAITDPPDHGTLGSVIVESTSPVRKATVLYTPDDFLGPDSFAFEACEAALPSNCDQATISVVIGETTPPAPPVAFDQSVETTMETPLLVSLAGSISVTPEPTDDGRDTQSASRTGASAGRRVAGIRVQRSRRTSGTAFSRGGSGGNGVVSSAGPSAQASGPVSLVFDAGWSDTSVIPPAFFWTGTPPVFSEDGPFLFTGAGCVSVTDAFTRGDHFSVYDNGQLIGSSSVVAPDQGQTEVTDPNLAYPDPLYSSGTFVVSAGAHSITVEVIPPDSLSGGRGYLRVDSPGMGLCPGPDLIIDTLSHAPTSPTSEDRIDITAVVKNQGGTAAPASTVCIDVGGETCASPTSFMLFSIPALGPGESANAVRNIGLSQGNYITAAEADVLDDVVEGDEGNNTATDSFTVSEAGAQQPSLFFIVTSLPANGTLKDSAGTPITIVPATLADSLVTYEPDAGFTGTDAFDYQVSKDGLLSNIASISVLVFETGCSECAVLAIELTGDGHGDVASNPRAENDVFVCSSDCEMEFVPGLAVTLQARPQDGFSTFNGWSGDCSGSGPVITITLGAAGTTRTCEAQFNSAQ